MADSVERARHAFAHRAWREACTLLAASDTLAPDDLERLAVAAYLVGRDAESARAWERAHLEWARGGDSERAARCAFWLGFGFLLRGEVAQMSGWLARATRLVEDGGVDSATSGYLRLPVFLESLGGGDASTAFAIGSEIGEIGQEFQDQDLVAFGLLCRGQALVALGETVTGVRLLDEVMVAVVAGELSPITAGIVYCAVIEACMYVFDLRRAAEWTAALNEWCVAQPDLVPYRGQCLVHQAQVLQAHGRWAEAGVCAEDARLRLSESLHPALGPALYQQGELHRLRGELAAAEHAYRAASEQGLEPAPGLALLRLAEGKVDSAVAAVRRMVEESQGRPTRPTMLAASVEIMLAAGDVSAARADADELVGIAADVEAPLLRAIASYACGSVDLAEGDPYSALVSLRDAFAVWRSLEMPYDAARARARIASACRALGDQDAADLELGAAREVLQRLGAVTDLAWLDGVLGQAEAAPAPGRLTSRECEVLRLVATGQTNREIAAELFISDHTVGRHLQNIFLKLDLSTRAAATAYAYEHGIV